MTLYEATDINRPFDPEKNWGDDDRVLLKNLDSNTEPNKPKKRKRRNRKNKIYVKNNSVMSTTQERAAENPKWGTVDTTRALPKTPLEKCNADLGKKEDLIKIKDARIETFKKTFDIKSYVYMAILLVSFIILVVMACLMTQYGQNDIIYDEQFTAKFLLDVVVMTLLIIIVWKGRSTLFPSLLGILLIGTIITIPVQYILMFSNTLARQRSIGTNIKWPKIVNKAKEKAGLSTDDPAPPGYVSECQNDPEWQHNNKGPGFNCEWVAEQPETRCSVNGKTGKVNGTVVARDGCKKACGIGC